MTSLLAPSPVDPLEDDNLLSEILLRLPPQPSSLPRASLVSTRWLRLVSDPAFLRRFRAHHRFRKPPLLGCFIEKYGSTPFVSMLDSPNRVPDGCIPPLLDHQPARVLLDCRHGLVLFVYLPPRQILVWDPVTGDQSRLAVPPRLDESNTLIHGAVVRSAGDVDFQVVLVGTGNTDATAIACAYSSETGVWGNLATTPLPPMVARVAGAGCVMPLPGTPSALVGDSLYWLFYGNKSNILEFSLSSQSLAVIPVPVDTYPDPNYRFRVMRAEGGGLGFIYLSGFTAQLWKRKTESDGVAGWVLGKTIELDRLLSLNLTGLSIKGIAEENNVLFLLTVTGFFTLQLDSLQFKKLGPMSAAGYYPLEGVYTAESGAHALDNPSG